MEGWMLEKQRMFLECKKPKDCDSKPIYVGEFDIDAIVHTKVFNLTCEKSHLNHYMKVDLKTEQDLGTKLKNGYVDRSKQFRVLMEIMKHLAQMPEDRSAPTQLTIPTRSIDSAKTWLEEAERMLETHYLPDSPIFMQFKSKVARTSNIDEKVKLAREWLDDFINRGCQ